MLDCNWKGDGTFGTLGVTFGIEGCPTFGTLLFWRSLESRLRSMGDPKILGLLIGFGVGVTPRTGGA